jgi:hypothetical protein
MMRNGLKYNKVKVYSLLSIVDLFLSTFFKSKHSLRILFVFKNPDKFVRSIK